MTGRDYLWCALTLLLAEEQALDRLGPACRARAEEDCCPICGGQVSDWGKNDMFDQARFEEMKRGGRV